eukprot:CFRG5829T1
MEQHITIQHFISLAQKYLSDAAAVARNGTWNAQVYASDNSIATLLILFLLAVLWADASRSCVYRRASVYDGFYTPGSPYLSGKSINDANSEKLWRHSRSIHPLSTIGYGAYLDRCNDWAPANTNDYPVPQRKLSCSEHQRYRKHPRRQLASKKTYEIPRTPLMCDYCKQSGHRWGVCPRFYFDSVICENCHQNGHYKSKCPFKLSAPSGA